MMLSIHSVSRNNIARPADVLEEGKLMMLKDVTSYDQVVRRFSWKMPETLNIAWGACKRNAFSTPNALALAEDTETNLRQFTFADLKPLSDNLTQSFVDLGVTRGTRVVVSLGQDAEGLLSHLACFKIGAISVPIAALYSDDGGGRSGSMVLRPFCSSRTEWERTKLPSWSFPSSSMSS